MNTLLNSKHLARFLRGCSKLRFRLLGLATIKDIPTDRFNALWQRLLADGWIQTYEYSGVDAWLDYGCVKLRKGPARLKLEWDNWTEGSVEGRRELIEAIGRRFDLPVSHEWRWSEYDDNV